MHKPSLIITLIIMVFPLILSRGILHNLPWNSNVLWISNISAYTLIILISFSGILIYKTLVPLLDSSHNPARQSKLIKGSINTIEYSSYRIDNKPMFKVDVSYNGINQIFEPVNSKIQNNFNTGDSVYIWMNPNDSIDAYLDLEKSLEIDNKNPIES